MKTYIYIYRYRYTVNRYNIDMTSDTLYRDVQGTYIMFVCGFS